MSRQRIAMFERLTRQYLNSNTKWAAKFGEELSRLRAAEREVMEKKIERLVDEVKRTSGNLRGRNATTEREAGMSEQTDHIDIMELDDDAFETRLAQIDEQLEDNKENDGDENEFKALLEQRTEVRQQQQAATKERDTRQKSSRDNLKKLAYEATILEAKLAEGLSPEEEVEARARQAYVADRRATLEAGLPFAGVPTEKLEGNLEALELEREELWARLKAAEDNQGLRPAHYRKVRREYEALAERQATLRTELQTRELQGVNKELAHRAAVRHAERELRAEDAKAISEADENRRGTRAEDLAESFEARLELRIPVVEQRLWRQAEVSVGRALMGPGKAVEPLASAREDKLREDERAIEQERIRQEQAQQRQRRVQPRSWPIGAERGSR